MIAKSSAIVIDGLFSPYNAVPLRMDVCAIPLASRRIDSALINIGRGPFKRARSSNFKRSEHPILHVQETQRQARKSEINCRWMVSLREPRRKCFRHIALNVQPSKTRRARGHVAGNTTAYWNAGVTEICHDVPQIAKIKHRTLQQHCDNVAMLL